MFQPMDKELISILSSNYLLSWTYDYFPTFCLFMQKRHVSDILNVVNFKHKINRLDRKTVTTDL